MCGIAGYTGEAKEGSLERMLAAVKHRGPDDSGRLERGEAHFAHARLSIIDTSSGARQPMELPGGSEAVMFNGEIYNFKELRRELEAEGASFKTNSDTEVILWLYRVHGEGAFEKLAGMFAIALYDFKQKKLLLARDRMGEKPLYWSLQNSTLLFGSEMKALFASGLVEKRIDLAAVEQYLLLDYVPTPSSIIAGVYKLEPATLLTYQSGTITKKKFWQPPTAPLLLPLKEATAELGRHIEHSVGQELLSDVPLGVFLSGGIDSSTVAYFAQKNSTRPIDTFSIGFDTPAFDESAYARAVAKKIGSNHHEKIVTAADALALIPSLGDTLCEPLADASILPTLLLSQFAREHVTVALGGDGGDELFAGYPTFAAEHYFSLYDSLPQFAKSFARAGASLLPASHGNLALSYTLNKFMSGRHGDAPERHLEWLGSFGGAARLAVMGEALRGAKSQSDVFAHLAQYEKEFDSPDAGNNLLWVYARTYLMDQVLVKVDRASMRYALETRAPLLNHPLVEYAFSLPYDFKYRGGNSKFILKELMRGKLPATAVDRKKKGFGIPLAAWLAGPLRPLCEELLSPSALAEHGLFNSAEVERLKSEHMAGRRDNRKELWNLMIFQLWYRRWMR